MARRLWAWVFVFSVMAMFGCPSAVGALQVHLALDGNLYDAAGRDQDGMLVDGIQGTHGFAASMVGQGLRLGHVGSDPGTSGNDYVRIPYRLTDTGTVALWFYVEDVYNYVTLFDNPVDQNDWELWIYATGVARFRIQSGGEVSADLHTLAADGDARGDWFHFVVTWERLSATEVETFLYVNGQLQQSRTGPWVDPGSEVFLGGGHGGNDAGIGVWDDVRIYDHRLEESEIRWLARDVLTVEPGTLRVTEGRSGLYQVALAYPPGQEPSGEVRVTVEPGADLAVNGGAPGQSVVLVYEPGSFTTPQVVEVTVVDDGVSMGNRTSTLRHTIASDDPAWDGVPGRSVAVFILEDDLECGAWGYNAMDFNRDCYVNLADFAEFASQWLACTDPGHGTCLGSAGVVVVAHRGYSHAAPENTVAACNAARGYADMVEFDVRSAQDGWLVLMHDATVDRTTDGAGAVADMTLAALRRLDAGSWFSAEFAGQRVPTLEEAILAILPDMVPFVERKTGTPEQYLEVFGSLQCSRQVIVIAFDWQFLAALEAADPGIITGALGGGELTDSSIDAIAALGIDFIDWEHSSVTADVVERAHAAGLELWVWTVNAPARVQALLDMGVDGITTDDPVMVRQVLNSH